MPIRLRLALAFAVVVAIVFTVVALLFERSFRNGLESSLDQTLRVQASALARAVDDAGGTVDLGDRAAGALRDDDDVAQLLDADGRVVDATEDLQREPLVPVDDIPRAGEGALVRRVDVAEQDEDDDDDDLDTEAHRVVARAVEGVDRVGYVVVGTSLESTDDAVDRLTTGLLVGGVAAVALAGVGAWFLAGAALRPVERLRREAESLSVHDPSARLEVARTHDELEALGATMNELLSRLQGALARQRAFVADAGHELRTPIAVLRTELELARRDGRTREELVDAVDHAHAETERLAELTDALLLLARSDDPASVSTRRDRVVVGDVVALAVEGVTAAAASRHVEIAAVCEDSIVISGDAHLLRRAVENLLENAVRHSPDGSEIRVAVSEQHGTVGIAVADRGPGFPDDFLPHAFERFRRADDARTRSSGGQGLGLAIVLAIMRAHDGDAVVANRPDGGAVVTLSLPARSPTAGPPTSV